MGLDRIYHAGSYCSFLCFLPSQEARLAQFYLFLRLPSRLLFYFSVDL